MLSIGSQSHQDQVELSLCINASNVSEWASVSASELEWYDPLDDGSVNT